MPISSGKQTKIQKSSNVGAWIVARTLVGQLTESGPPPSGWIDLSEPFSLVEVSYENLSVAGAPTFVYLYLWRQVGAKTDIADVIRIPVTELTTWKSERIQIDAQHVQVRVGFEGGVAPSLTGTIHVRSLRAGETTINPPMPALSVSVATSPPVVQEESGSVVVDGNSFHYIDMSAHDFFSVQFLPIATGTGANISLSYQVSNELSQPNIALRDYSTDVSESWFGDASFPSGVNGTEPHAHEHDTRNSWLSVRLKVTVAGRTAGSPSWKIKVRKTAN